MRHVIVGKQDDWIMPIAQINPVIMAVAGKLCFFANSGTNNPRQAISALPLTSRVQRLYALSYPR